MYYLNSPLGSILCINSEKCLIGLSSLKSRIYFKWSKYNCIQWNYMYAVLWPMHLLALLLVVHVSTCTALNHFAIDPAHIKLIAKLPWYYIGTLSAYSCFHCIDPPSSQAVDRQGMYHDGIRYIRQLTVWKVGQMIGRYVYPGEVTFGLSGTWLDLRFRQWTCFGDQGHVAVRVALTLGISGSGTGTGSAPGCCSPLISITPRYLTVVSSERVNGRRSLPITLSDTD